MTAFPKYPAYKPSGVEWLGDVPEHWEVEKGLRYFYETESRSTTGDEELLSVSHLTGVTPRSEKNITMFMAESYEGSKLCEVGDIAINTMWAWMAALGVSRYRGLVSPSYGTYRQKKPEPFNPTFLDHLIRMDVYRSHYTVNSTGITTSRLRLYPHSFLRLKFVCPPRAEQGRIVAFLDEKTAQIDALIAKKQRQIELLDEQRGILINRAVTRGIGNGELRIVNEVAAEAASDHSTFTIQNSQFKDSGITWIGPIPKGWEVKSAKHVCERIIDCKNRTAEVVTQGDYYVLRTSNVKKGELVRDEITRTNLKNFTIWTERGAPEAGDVLFTREAPAGEACVFDGSLPACLGQRMMYFRPDTSQLLPQFLVHTIYFGPSATYIQLKTNGSTVGHLRLPDVYALPVLFPPVDEQRRILDVLAATEESQKKLIQTMQSQIQTLQTLRSTLIAHTVTGKIAIPAATV